jgi:hypothetical protein
VYVATGRCWIPLGTTKSSPALRSIGSCPASSMRKLPSQQRNSSSSSCWCQGNSPSSRATRTTASLAVTRSRGCQGPGSVPITSVTETGLPGLLLISSMNQVYAAASIRGHIPSAQALASAIVGDAPTIPQALAQTQAKALVFTKVEQLYVKNRPVLLELVHALPKALASRMSEGRALNVGLVDLSTKDAEAVVADLHNAPTDGIGTPVPVFHYPPMA